MKQYEEVFFSILRASLWKTPVEIPEGFDDWGKVLKLAKTQALTGLLGDVLLTNPAVLSKLPSKAVAKLQDIPLTNMGTYTVLNNTLILVVSKLREHGIEPVLLKGQGIAQYYPIPALRQCGDIDLYVGEENYEKTYHVLTSIVTEIDSIDSLYKDIKHFHAKIGSILIEIHRFAYVDSSKKIDLAYQNYSKKGLSEGLVKVSFGEINVNTPEVNFNAIYIFNHLWHHFITSGVGLRQFCDFMCYLHVMSGRLDLDYIEGFLKKMNLHLFNS